MILTPREEQTLSYLDGQLAAGEPRLAAMFSIFTRLTAQEGKPPEEDQIRGPRPAAAQRRPRARRVRVLWRVIVPAVMLAALAVLVALGLTSSMRCQPAAPRPHTPAAASSGCPARGPGSPARATGSRNIPAA
jgi:hypothetical protein